MRILYTFLVLGIMMISLESCSVKKASHTQDLQAQCCKECVEAFSQSPVGIGATGARCGYFSSAAKISAPCQKFFREQEIMVSACQ